MAANTFGTIFRLTSFGESHGKAIGGIIDGCPPGLKIDYDFIQNELSRRKPGQSKITTKRKEEDKVEFLSGIFDDKTTGAPIGFVIWNSDARPKDYDKYKDVLRPSHSDYTYSQKYGNRDYRGGGRSSARVTIPRVVAGAIAKLFLKKLDVEIYAYTSRVGDLIVEKNYKELDLSKIDSNIVRCPDPDMADKMIEKIDSIRMEGNTIGGIITGVAKNVPVGLGEPVFDKLHAQLGKSILSINAVKGFDIGSGFNSVSMVGSEHNDKFFVENGKVRTETNNSGGVQGGISNGEDIYFNAVFKPVATIMKKMESIDINLKETTILPKGRHDPCVLPRAVPIVEAMTAMVIFDFYLQSKALEKWS